MSVASFYNLACKGVGSTSSCSTKALTLPIHDCYPTTKTNIFPSPESTLVPLMMIGLGI